jgi:hypothetical protein
MAPFHLYYALAQLLHLVWRRLEQGLLLVIFNPSQERNPP